MASGSFFFFFFGSYFIGFWVMQCTGDDLHFPCITAKNDNTLAELPVNFLDWRCKVVLQTAEEKVLLMEVFTFYFLLLKTYSTKAVIVCAWSLPKEWGFCWREGDFYLLFSLNTSQNGLVIIQKHETTSQLNCPCCHYAELEKIEKAK